MPFRTSVVILTAVACAQTPDLELRTLRIRGRDRTYCLYRPSGAGPASRPLVLAFHGGGGDGKGMARLTGMNIVAARLGVLVAYPDGIDRHWGDGRARSPAVISQGENDITFVRAIIDDLTRRDHADPRRVYAAGISNGGFFAARLGCEVSDRIAAIAIVAATMPAYLSSSAACRPAAPLPVLLIHGSADPIVPASGGENVGGRGYSGPAESASGTARFWAKANRCADTPAVTELPVKVEDGTRISRTAWSGCPQSAVVFYEVIGGGHTWPGGMQYLPPGLIGRTTHNLDASAAILDFFLRFAAPASNR